MLPVCSRNGLTGWVVKKSPSGQTESPASVNLSVAFVNFVLWMRSVFQAILQPMGLLRGPRGNDRRRC